MTTQVFIPTLNRAHIIEKTLPRWLEQDKVVVNLLIDPTAKERRAYRDFRCNVLDLPDTKMGMGAIRQYILEYATDARMESFVMSDDDAFPYRGDVEALCHTVINEDIVGCGACSSYHGLMIGNEILDTRTRFPIAGGYGHILVAINVANALYAGGYPNALTAWGEDTELQRRGIVEEMPWYYSTAVEMKSVAKRYSPGGLASQYSGALRRAQEKKSHKWIYKEWGPEYVSQPSRRFRFQWKKFQDDYDPTWQDRVPRFVRRILAAK